MDTVVELRVKSVFASDSMPRMQVKLLRVLDGASYFRLGGVKKITVPPLRERSADILPLADERR